MSRRHLPEATVKFQLSLEKALLFRKSILRKLIFEPLSRPCQRRVKDGPLDQEFDSLGQVLNRLLCACFRVQEPKAQS